MSKPTYEELEQERNELAAQIKQLQRLKAAAKKHGVSREALYYRHKHLGLSGEQMIKGFRAASQCMKNLNKSVTNWRRK